MNINTAPVAPGASLLSAHERRRVAAAAPARFRSPIFLTALGLTLALALLFGFFVHMQARVAQTHAQVLADARWAQLQWQCSAVPNVMKREACVAQLSGGSASRATEPTSYTAPDSDALLSLAELN